MKKYIVAVTCVVLLALLLIWSASRTGEPVRPDVPDPPDEQEQQEQPEEPVEPDEPEQPEEPVEPEEPDQPEEPVEPEEPEESEQPEEPEEPDVPPAPDTAEARLAQMTLREKVGQVFWILPEQLVPGVANSKIRDSSLTAVTSVTGAMGETLAQYPAGGFVLFSRNIRTPAQLKAMTDGLRSACDVAPVIAVDEEGGRVARIARNPAFGVANVGSMESLAASGDPAHVRAAAAEIGAYLAAYGFTMDLAPVADMNTNPQNVVIGDRAFGSDPDTVSAMVAAYVEGLHSQGVSSVLKHFPGHGDTVDDSHKGTVTVNKTWEELCQEELIPFIRNFRGTDAVMVAHINLPNVTDDGLPATLSRELIHNKLRQELGYDGLILTDSLCMGAIIDNYTPAQAAVLAFEAGSDVLLLPENYVEAFEGLLSAVEKGQITEERLDESVLRILRVKYGG